MSVGVERKSRKISYPYRAVVEDNIDPKKYGRIKARVYPMFADTTLIPTTQLPWAVPAMGLFVGAGAGFGGFCVPEIGTMVFVFFEAGDPYQPVYFAAALDALKGIPSSSATDYPFTKVWRTKNGIEIKLDDKSGSEDILVTHPKGSTIHMDKDGNIIITSALKDINIVSTKGSIAVTADVGITVKAENILLDAPVVKTSKTFEVGTGATGVFTDVNGKTIGVQAGIVTSMQ